MRRKIVSTWSRISGKVMRWERSLRLIWCAKQSRVWPSMSFLMALLIWLYHVPLSLFLPAFILWNTRLSAILRTFLTCVVIHWIIASCLLLMEKRVLLVATILEASTQLSGVILICVSQDPPLKNLLNPL